MLSPSEANACTGKVANSFSRKISTSRPRRVFKKSSFTTSDHTVSLPRMIKNRTRLQRLWQFSEDPCVEALGPQVVVCKGCREAKLLDSRRGAEYYDGLWTKHKISCKPCHELVPGGHAEHPLIKGMPKLTIEVYKEIRRQEKLDSKRYKEHLKGKKDVVDHEVLEKLAQSLNSNQAVVTPTPYQGSLKYFSEGVLPYPRSGLTEVAAHESGDEICWDRSLGQQDYHQMQENQTTSARRSFDGLSGTHHITGAGTILVHPTIELPSQRVVSVRDEYARFQEEHATPGAGSSSGQVHVRERQDPLNLLASIALQKLALDSN
ncbi:hypothetical protein K435DRAFT_876584 [Dendrothele bispora CBS 962.96]|uniref:Stc1 domain-containing protein n=1 Tax=Dendrothele bispora (strain CBS 962.96) TaxID=1314807 RepID=A0A4S8KSV7_DENBC|nr:hypothetical protein K435DRAFT_876584 [Dendrothele bispora CBS 962.96]